MSQSDPFQELVGNLRCVLTAPPPPAQATTSVSTIASPSPPLIASPMARPAPFSGVAEECNGFLLQCSLYIENQPHLYTTERSKVSFLISLLSGKALQWSLSEKSLDGLTVIPPRGISFITSSRVLSPSRSMHWGSESSRLPAAGMNAHWSPLTAKD